MAILAGGMVLGLGTTATLATWTDTEWVFGGTASGNDPGVGTSTFEVLQNVSTPYTPGSFANSETNPGQSLNFTMAALSLSPGDTVYAPVALRTADDSIEGEVLLKSAVPATGITTNDPSDLLWGALNLRVSVSPTSVDCDATAFTTTADIIATNTLGAAEASTTQFLAELGTGVQFYCFEVTLPTTPTLTGGATISDLQGRTVAPAWLFAGESL